MYIQFLSRLTEKECEKGNSRTSGVKSWGALLHLALFVVWCSHQLLLSAASGSIILLDSADHATPIHISVNS